MVQQKACDILIFGASGSTGRIVCEYVAQTYAKNQIRFGIAGHNMKKLQDLRESLGKIDKACLEWPMIVADSTNQTQTDEAVRQTRIVCNIVGPFHQKSTPVVDACVRLGVDYVDISGETPWIRTLIDKYHAQAGGKGVYIIPACGYVSTPFDLGAMLIERVLTETAERDVYSINAITYDCIGGLSRGSLDTYQTMKTDRHQHQLLDEPYLLNPPSCIPEITRPAEKDQIFIGYDRAGRFWTMPSLFALTDTRIVRRSIAMRDKKYIYNEADGFPTFLGALFAYVGLFISAILMYFWITRTWIQKYFWPQSDEKPSHDVIDHGRFNIRFVGTARPRGQESPRHAFVTVHAKLDPAGRATARCVIESAMCLALHKEDIQKENPFNGGVMTPSAMGMTLVDRLKHSGIHFEVHLDEPSGVPNSLSSR